MYLWFYEWNLFDAFETGDLAQGTWRHDVRIRDDGRAAEITSKDGAIRLDVRTNDRGATMILTVTNLSDHDWGPLATIVPCFNPGPGGGSRKILQKRRTEAFINTNTYYPTADGLEKIQGRRIHFHENHFLDSGQRHAFADRWPPGDTPVTGGFLLRESNDKTWIAAIAWEDALTVQAHNEWDCMHVGVRVGPLARGQTKTILGQIHLAPSTLRNLVDFATLMRVSPAKSNR